MPIVVHLHNLFAQPQVESQEAKSEAPPETSRTEVDLCFIMLPANLSISLLKILHLTQVLSCWLLVKSFLFSLLSQPLPYNSSVLIKCLCLCNQLLHPINYVFVAFPNHCYCPVVTNNWTVIILLQYWRKVIFISFLRILNHKDMCSHFSSFLHRVCCVFDDW